jgi:hypothetical protein
MGKGLRGRSARDGVVGRLRGVPWTTLEGKDSGEGGRRSMR